MNALPVGKERPLISPAAPTSGFHLSPFLARLPAKGWLLFPIWKPEAFTEDQALAGYHHHYQWHRDLPTKGSRVTNLQGLPFPAPSQPGGWGRLPISGHLLSRLGLGCLAFSPCWTRATQVRGFPWVLFCPVQTPPPHVDLGGGLPGVPPSSYRPCFSGPQRDPWEVMLGPRLPP